MSKIEAGKLELDSIDFDLEVLVEDLVASFSQQAASKGLALSCSLEAGVPRAVRGDAGRLRQVLGVVVIAGYDLHMRTTISLDDRLAERVRSKAAEKGLSVSAFIARTLDDALKRQTPSASVPFRLITVKGDGLFPGVELDRARALFAEDDETQFGGRSREP